MVSKQSEQKWPKSTRHKCEFFESLGADPKRVMQDGVNEMGYRYMVANEHGRQVYDLESDRIVAEFVPWPNGEADWHAFLKADDLDYPPFRDKLDVS